MRQQGALSWWDEVSLQDRAMVLTPRLAKSGCILATEPSSVVHTGVKSLGCEKSTAQLSPIHSWNFIGPIEVSASKSGTTSPRLMLPGIVAEKKQETTLTRQLCLG